MWPNRRTYITRRSVGLCKRFPGFRTKTSGYFSLFLSFWKDRTVKLVTEQLLDSGGRSFIMKQREKFFVYFSVLWSLINVSFYMKRLIFVLPPFSVFSLLFISFPIPTFRDFETYQGVWGVSQVPESDYESKSCKKRNIPYP